MKNLLRLFMLAVLFLPLALNAQLSATYLFSTGVDNTQWYTLTSDSTVLKVGTGNDSYASPVTNIGFTFTFAGVDYTQFSANSDGTVRLGSTAVTTGSYATPFSTSNANSNAPKICGLGCDGYLVAATDDSPADYIAYQLFGTDGDHVLVIEISTGTYTSDTRNNHYTFQVQLAEADNSVTLIYSPIAPAAGPAVTYQLGACANGNDIVLFNVSDNTMSTYTAGTSTNNASGTWPAPGRFYTITPDPNACYAVTSLAASNITATSATLTWSDDNNTGASYSIYDGETLIASGINGNTYDLTGLSANTSYDINVITNCSSDNASAAATVNIHTACGATSLPWTCSFEENEIVNTTQATALPWCTERYVSTATSGTSYPYSYSGSSYAHTGSRSLYFYGTTSSSYPDTSAIILPEIDVTNYPMSGNRITFWARMGAASNTKTLYIGSMTDPADISTLTVIDNVTVTGNTHTKFSIPLATATGAYIVIMAPKGTGNIYLDDVTIEEMPSCMEITNLTVSGTTANSVTLNWVDAANVGATYTIYDMSDNTVIDNNISTTTYTVDNLTPNTTYNFGVETNCASADAAIITVSATTDCATETMPWSENFDNWTSKSACWSFLSGAFSGTPTPSTSAWTLNSTYGTYLNISGKALTMNVYSTNRYWAVTPPITITEDNAMLSVDVAVAAWSAAAPNYDDNDTLAFAITTDDGATYIPLLVFDNTQLNTLGNDYTTLYAPVTGYNGQTVRFAIFAGSSASGGDNRIAIDNVTVAEAAACMPVASLSASEITAFGATLTWQGDAPAYTIYNMADTSVIQTTTDTSVVINTLNPDTPYTLGVQANCGTDQSVIVNVSFTTLVTCAAPTNLTAILTPGDGTVASLSWTEVGTAQAWQICLNGDTNNLIDATTNPYDLTGLTPEQAYTAQVRANCAVDDQSEWSNLVNFTPTDAYLITVNEGTSTNSYVPIYGLWVDDITKSQFIIPASYLTAMQFGSINKLTFYSSNANVSWGAATFNVYVTETSATTLSALEDYTTMNQVYAGTLSISNNTMEVNFTTPYLYMGGNLMIGFLQTNEGTYSSCNWYGVSATGASMGGYGSSISQRNFLPKTTIAYTPGDQPSCLPVTGLVVSNITGTGATMTWNGEASSYNIYDMSDTTFVANVTTTTYDFTNLTPMTGYTYGVRSVCNGEESPISVVSFTTACAAVSLPYTETFESTSSTRNCWDLVATGNIGGSNGMGFVTVSDREVLRFSSYSSASDYNQYGYSPLMNVSSTATNLVVNVVYATYGANDILNFGYVTATDTVWYTDDYTTTGNTDWQTLTLVVPATATQLAIHYYGNYQYYAWIDTVSVAELTGDFCYAVTNLSVDNATQNSISLSWTDNNNTGITYTIYEGANVVATNVATTSYVVTGLTAATDYTFGVVANCSATETSDMVTINASTECADITTLPYDEGFENGLGCWTTVNGSADGNPWNAQAAFSSGSIAPHSGDGMAASWSWNNVSMHANAWLISPKFILPNTTEPIIFTWWERANPSYADHYSVVLSTTTNDTAAFTTVVRPYDTAAGSWTMQTIDLSAYAGQSIYLAFHHVDYDENYLLIDDINLSEGGVTPPAPDTLTVVFSVDDATMGTTIPAPGTYQFVAGDTCFFGSQANPGYHFLMWVVDYNNGSVDTLGAAFANNYYLKVANVLSQGITNMSFTAYFVAGEPDSTYITYAVNDPTRGTTIPAPGTYTIHVGDIIGAQAIPNEGYELYAWVWGLYVNGNPLGMDTVDYMDPSFANPLVIGALPQVIVDNNATMSLTAIFVPTGAQPCNVPTGLIANAVGPDYITIAWDYDSNVSSWNIRYRPVGGVWASASSTTSTYVINGLTSETQYEIQVQADCGDDISDWSESLIVTTTVGIENHLLNSINLYPNPASDYIDVRVDDINVTAMEVFDVYGKLINTVNVIDNPTRINVAGLATGMYFVRVTTEQGVATKSFIKK